MSLWDYAPWAIQVWNTSNRDGVMTAYQLGALIMLIMVGLVVMVQIINRVTQDDE